MLTAAAAGAVGKQLLLRAVVEVLVFPVQAELRQERLAERLARITAQLEMSAALAFKAVAQGAEIPRPHWLVMLVVLHLLALAAAAQEGGET